MCMSAWMPSNCRLPSCWRDMETVPHSTTNMKMLSALIFGCATRISITSISSARWKMLQTSLRLITASKRVLTQTISATFCGSITKSALPSKRTQSSSICFSHSWRILATPTLSSKHWPSMWDFISADFTLSRMRMLKLPPNGTVQIIILGLPSKIGKNS